jgi:glyoxylase-like metal-dependent hydrolase (beta-lactamase superfamily II)
MNFFERQHQILLERGPDRLSPFLIPGMIVNLASGQVSIRTGVAKSLRLIPFQLGLWLGRPKHVPSPVDELLKDGDAFGPLEVLYAPGHSPGHLAFWWPERRFLIAGDGVATWPELCPGWHSFNLNRPQHHATLQRLAALDAAIVGVGHGDPITEGAQDKVHGLASRPVP